MKIRVIKRKPNDDSNDLKTPEVEKSVEQGTREMVSTVKSWIAELQERKRAKGISSHAFLHLPAVAPAPVSD